MKLWVNKLVWYLIAMSAIGGIIVSVQHIFNSPSAVTVTLAYITAPFCFIKLLVSVVLILIRDRSLLALKYKVILSYILLTVCILSDIMYSVLVVSTVIHTALMLSGILRGLYILAFGILFNISNIADHKRYLAYATQKVVSNE